MPKKKYLAVYLRVSTDKQDTKNQEPELKVWLKKHRKGRAVRWYRDNFSGASTKRPGYQKLEADIKSGQVATLIVWRLDRLGRTVLELLRFLEDLEQRAVEFVSVRDAINTKTPTGRLALTMVAGFAQYEHEIMGERIRAGIKRAKAEGKTWGGKQQGQRSRLTDEKLKAVRTLLKAKTGKAEIARQLEISERSVYRAVKLLA